VQHGQACAEARRFFRPAKSNAEACVSWASFISPMVWGIAAAFLDSYFHWINGMSEVADEPINIVLEHLPEMRADVAAIREENREMKARQAAVEDMFSFLVSAITRLQHSFDRLTERVERIEKRLGLIDAPAP